MIAAAGGGRGGGRLPLVCAVGGLLLLADCRRDPGGAAHPGAGDAAGLVDAAGPRDAGGPDGPGAADLGPRLQDEPANLLRAAEFAWTHQEDRELAREILRLALEAISRRLGNPTPVMAALAQGLADPNFATQPRAEVALSSGSDRIAIGHGRLLSLIELPGGPGEGGPLEPPIRLAESVTPLRRVVLDRDGRRIATLADDGIARLMYTSGDPGYQWPLMAPPDPEQPEQPGREDPYRASWLDFSPDARFLFLADCGVAATRACALRRLRVFDTERGQTLPTFTADQAELIDYTARRDGTLAVLFSGRPPQLYQTTTGVALPLTSTLPGPTAQACLAGTRPPQPKERGWVVSPDRRWLATLAAPATLCLWDLDERRLTAAVALPGSASTHLHLESLLSDQSAYAVVVSTAERSGARRTYLLDPNTGQRRAEFAGPAAVMPLDDGGALLSGHQLDGPRRGGLQLYRLPPRGQLVRLPGPELAALRCVADFPDAVEGSGGQALFSPLDPAASPDCPTVLLALTPGPRPGAQLRRLALPGRAPIAAANFIGTPGRLILVDAAARLQTFDGSQLRYATPPVPAAVTRLGFAAPGDGDQLLLGTEDGQTTELWTTGGTLRHLPAPPGPRPVSPARAAPPRAVSADARLVAALELAQIPGPKPPLVLSLRDAAGALRWQAPLFGLPPVTALAFTPDATLLLVGAAGGTVVWLRVSDGSQRLRLQLVPGGAVAVTPDGRFELLGEVEHPADYVFCRAGTYQIPLPLCTGRLRTRGLLAIALRL